MPTRLGRALALSAALAAPLAAPAQPLERPQWNPGDSWTIRTTVARPGGSTVSETVRSVKGARDDGYQLLLEESGSGKAPSPGRATRDLNGIQTTPDGEAQELRWLQWPLEPGRKYAFDVKSGGNVFTWNGTVAGWESVTTPAGTFKALKVSFSRSGPSRFAASETIWFVPEMKAIAKRVSVRPNPERGQDTTTTEVVAFRVN